MELSATKRKDPVSGITWLEFDQDLRTDGGARTSLSFLGWRFSGKRVQWYNNRRYPQIPSSITITDGGECNYSADRAERLAEVAESARRQSLALNEHAEEVISMIPMGQPIQPGDQRHRNTLEKIGNYGAKAAELSDKAEDLQQAAVRSAANQKKQTDRGKLERRLATYEASLRKLERERPAREAAEPERFAMMVAETEKEIARLKGLLATTTNPLDTLDLQPGDVILIGGHEMEVLKVNERTIKCRATSGTGWEPAMDKSKFKRVIRRKDTNGHSFNG